MITSSLHNTFASLSCVAYMWKIMTTLRYIILLSQTWRWNRSCASRTCISNIQLFENLSCSTLPAERLLTVGKDQVCKRFHEGHNSWYHEAYQEKNQERIQMGICQVRGGGLELFCGKGDLPVPILHFFKTLLKSRGGPTNPKISCCKLAKA